jgi:hypothetical protein
MNVDNIGINFANICHKDDKGHHNDIPIFAKFLRDKTKCTTFNELIIPDNLDDNEYMQQMPFIDLKYGVHRNIAYISGQSGSGKSYYMTQYVKRYRKMFPKNPIIIFSSVPEDKSIDSIKNTIRIPLDDNFIKMPISIAQDLSHSFVLFDDCLEMISNPSIQAKLNDIMSKILTVGRHYHISAGITTHVAQNYDKTRLILVECNSITCFPSTMSNSSLRRLMETSFGMDKEDIQKIKKLPSIWVTVMRLNSGFFVLYETGCYKID